MGSNLRERWLIALVAVCFAVIIGGALVVGLYLSEILESQLVQVHRIEHYPPGPEPGGYDVTVSNVTVFHHDDAIYSGTNKPLIVTSGLIAQDVRANYSSSSSLQISGRLNNTGGGTAYNAVLHVVAMNKEGTAIDTTYNFAGITPHTSLGLGFKLAYIGSAIDNCTITPVYTDHLIPQYNQTSP